MLSPRALVKGNPARAKFAVENIPGKASKMHFFIIHGDLLLSIIYIVYIYIQNILIYE